MEAIQSAEKPYIVGAAPFAFKIIMEVITTPSELISDDLIFKNLSNILTFGLIYFQLYGNDDSKWGAKMLGFSSTSY